MSAADAIALDEAPPLLYTAERAIERMGLAGIKSPRWLKDQARAERIPVTPIGKTLMWSEQDLLAIVRQLHREPRNRRSR